MRENEKLLVTSIFSFSHNVFHSYTSVACQNAALCGNGLTLYSINTHQQQTASENIVGKEEIARNEQFLLFPQCFLLNQILVAHLSIFLTSLLLFAAELEEPKIGTRGKGLTSMIYVHVVGVIAVAALVNISVFISGQVNMAAGAPEINMDVFL